VLPGHPLSTLLADLARDDLVAQLELAPLEQGDATLLARSLLQEFLQEAGGNDGRSMVERIVERTEGVPFFLVSCTRWLQTLVKQRGQPQSDQATTSDAQSQTADWAHLRPEEIEELPSNVAQSVQERVAALPAPAQQLLGVAAVVGKPVSGVILAEAAGQPEEDALLGLEAACQSGLLVERPKRSGPARYRFAHDLIREVVDAGLSAWRRTVLHRKVAEAFERKLLCREGAERAADRQLTQLAYHYARADVPEKAVIYLRQAGDQARYVYAHEDAAGYYRELAEFLDRLGRSCEAAQARSDLAIELARAGHLREALEPLEQAERFYRAAGDGEAMALVTLAMGHVHAALGTTDEGFARLQPLIQALEGEAGENALAATPPKVSASVSAQLQGALSDLSFMAGRYHAALDAAQRSVDAAQATSDEGLLARQRLPLGIALHAVGRTAEAVENLERAIEGAEAASDLKTLACALGMESWTYQSRGAFAQSKRIQERAMEASLRLGDPVQVGFSVFLDALLAYYTGDWPRARAICEQAHAILQALDLVLISSYPSLGLGWLNLLEGRSEEAERYLEEARTMAEQSSGDQVLRMVDALRAECDLLNGQPVAARDRLAPLFRHGLLQERTRVELLALRAWAAVQLGEEVEAQEFVNDSVGSAREHHLCLVLPDALRVQALWAMRQRRWREAECALEEACALSRTMTYPYVEAKALYVCGQLQVAQDEPERARAAFNEALAICHRLGERLYAAHIEHALAGLAT
jgi:tetratricopeptide (TPR) repeat protein